MAATIAAERPDCDFGAAASGDELPVADETYESLLTFAAVSVFIDGG